MFVYTLAEYERRILESHGGFAWFAAFAVAAALSLAARRRRLRQAEGIPIFQERNPLAYQRLNLVP
jgi:hypothetical protein